MASSKKTIVLIAHDGKKAELIGFVKDNIEFFKKYNLVATQTTGSLVSDAGLKVTGCDIFACLMRICDVHNVPLATNPATARLIIKGLNKG